MRTKNSSGFTLVEIMIVVGIIAILSGLFLVGSSKFRNAANDSRRKADLQKIAGFQELCATRNNGSYAADVATLKTCVGANSNEIPTDPVTKANYAVTASNACATLSDSTNSCVSW